MEVKFIEQKFKYDGSQLRSSFGYLEHSLVGDSVVSWVGPCDIPKDKIVDGEDLLQGSIIEGSEMLHFIFEFYHRPLDFGVAWQRLFSAIVSDLVYELSNKKLHRKGDDLYLGDKKFNISIATLSPMSCMVHYALNIKSEGAPVPICSLNDFNIEPNAFVKNLLSSIKQEIVSIDFAKVKVKPVS